MKAGWDMLFAQSGFATEAEFEAAMRRYEMYCENIPEPADRLSFMEFIGRPNAATQAQQAIYEQARGREFESEEELYSFFNEQMRTQNEAPKEDFEGLSSAEMSLIHHGTLEDNRALVELSGELDDDTALSSYVVSALRFTLTWLGNHGDEVRLTQAGSFPRVMCTDYLETDDEWRLPGEPVPPERSIPPLADAHDAAAALKYIRKSKNKAVLTKKGRSIVSSGTWADTYRELFGLVVEGYDWLYPYYEESHPPYLELIQHSALFLLYLLKRHPTGSEGDLYARFVRAFPMFTESVQDDPEAEERLQSIFDRIALREFLRPLGLVDLDFSPEADTLAEAVLYETTELFRRALEWKK